MNWSRVMLLIAAFVLGLGMDAWAGAPTDQVRSYTDRVLKVLEDPALTQPQRREAVRSLAVEAFDTTETRSGRSACTGSSERLPSVSSL